MEYEKVEESLQLALQLPQEEVLQNQELREGYLQDIDSWELIVRFSGDVEVLKQRARLHRATAEILLAQYAIVTIPADRILPFSRNPEVIYIEKAKRITSFVEKGQEASCPFFLSQVEFSSLKGNGVLVGVLDSGVDILHSEFIREDGKSAFLWIWNQTTGQIFSELEIQQAVEEKRQLARDFSGHGTHVTSIVVGNSGIAGKAEVLFVKLGSSANAENSNSIDLMRGVDAIVRQAIERNKPLAINISYGTNYGDHRGNSLIEQYLDEISNLWKMSICVGTGNEGTTGRHVQKRVDLDFFRAQGNREDINGQEEQRIDFVVSPYELSLNLQIWKSYLDEFDFFLILPSGKEVRIENRGGGDLGFLEYQIGQTKISYSFGMPTPYNGRQELFLVFLAIGQQIESGVWSLIVVPKRIRDGNYEMWLPVAQANNEKTRFLNPSLEGTITIPATAKKVISVGAYDARRMQEAGFSGRGNYKNCLKKPELVAPGVEIVAALPGGGTTSRNGTSMAVPFVSGAAALLLEWGIVRENDPYLYGEKLKAYLLRGTKILPGVEEYPNNEIGWGRLCIRDSFPS